MLLAFIICHLCVFVAANPFHKYPFVFLLDVGNEELEKTNSEQIRVSIPGGSLALRYPAIGNGDTISHIRVSGIDFGTDLKANIVDGGPGYKYVVLVFMGNSAVAYDAVVTIKTVSVNVLNSQNSESNTYQTEEDANNSSEDLNDDDSSQFSIQKSNTESMQSSVNMYSYAENESKHVSDEDNGSDDDGEDAKSDIDLDYTKKEDSNLNDDYDEDNNEKDKSESYSENLIQENDVDVQVQDIGTANGEEEDDDDAEINSPSVEQSPDYSEERPFVIDNNLYSKYKALEDHFNIERKVYSQEQLQKSQKPLYDEELSDYKDNGDSGYFSDDEGWNNSAEKYRDFNNKNYIDSDDTFAVAY